MSNVRHRLMQLFPGARVFLIEKSEFYSNGDYVTELARHMGRPKTHLPDAMTSSSAFFEACCSDNIVGGIVTENDEIKRTRYDPVMCSWSFSGPLTEDARRVQLVRQVDYDRFTRNEGESNEHRTTDD